VGRDGLGWLVCAHRLAAANTESVRAGGEKAWWLRASVMAAVMEPNSGCAWFVYSYIGPENTAFHAHRYRRPVHVTARVLLSGRMMEAFKEGCGWTTDCHAILSSRSG
jgi:hypothetical protein